MAPVFFKRYWANEEAIGEYSELYGITIDQRKTDPAQMIAYIEDNENFTPAKMNFNTGVFDYGSWADAFFMQIKPCIVNYNGTVQCYLNPNDYTKDIDGNTVSIDSNCSGNVMVEFPKIYWKIVDNGDNTANIYVCDGKKDKDFHCWSHLDANGNEIDYCYLSAYLGYVSSGVLRSYSEVRANSAINMATAIDDAKNNYPSKNTWFVESFADMTMVNILLMLIGKSTDSQNVFGQGRTRSSKPDVYGATPLNGFLNSKGLFYCLVPNSNQSAYGNVVKVFGIENWWGGCSRRIVGFIRKSKTEVLLKMTHSKVDGSTVEGFNDTGEGYIDSLDFPYGTTGFIKEMNFSKYGLSAKVGGATYNTGYTDSSSYSSGVAGLVHGKGTQIYNASSITYNTGYNSSSGIFSEEYKATTSNNAIPNINSLVTPECFCLTCKPLAK